MFLKEVRQVCELEQRRPKEKKNEEENKEEKKKKEKQGGEIIIKYETDDIERAKKIHQRKPTLFSNVKYLLFASLLLLILK